ncbi:hypothetical protein PRIC1_013729 [Phytophthora ramorum]
MASWQHYPGSWTPDEEAARLGGRTAANAPPMRFEDAEETKMDPFPGRDGRAQRPPSSQYYAVNTMAPQPPIQQEETRHQQFHAQQLPEYSHPQGYARYPVVQEHYAPMSYRDQWTYQAPAPRPQSTSVRGQWVTVDEQQTRRGGWMEGPEAPGALQMRPVASSTRRRTSGFLTTTLRLCAFHVANVFFALVACGVLCAGICSAVSMIPVCCIGLLIFQVLVYIGFALAQWDITLGNYIAPAHQCAYSNLLPPGRFVNREGLSVYRISPNLAFFSPLSLMAMLYFVLVKPVIGALSFLSVVLVVAPTVSFITSLTSQYHDNYDSIQIYGVGPTSLSRYPGLSLVGAICVTLVGVALMQLVAKISLGATRFFCCEKLAVATRHFQYQPLASNGYGTASTRS